MSSCAPHINTTNKPLQNPKPVPEKPRGEEAPAWGLRAQGPTGGVKLRGHTATESVGERERACTTEMEKESESMAAQAAELSAGAAPMQQPEWGGSNGRVTDNVSTETNKPAARNNVSGSRSRCVHPSQAQVHQGPLALSTQLCNILPQKARAESAQKGSKGARTSSKARQATSVNETLHPPRVRFVTPAWDAV